MVPNNLRICDGLIPKKPFSSRPRRVNFFQGAIDTTAGQKIIVLCLSPLGDTIFAIPAIRALRENYARARIVVLASRPATAVLKNNPYKLELVTDVDQLKLVKMLPLIRRCHFDMAISLSQAGSFFTRFCAAPRWGDFFSIPPQTGRPVVQTCLAVLQSVGVTCVSHDTEFWFDHAAEKVADDFLIQIGYRGHEPLVAMHCGGHYFMRKRWPPLYFAELADRLAHSGCRVILIGSGEDREVATEVLMAAPQASSAVGRLKLGETAALLKKCHLLIGNDSGPLHMGAALGVPTIGLFGPTHPRQFYPYAAPEHQYLYKEFPCSPCFQFGGGLWQHVPRCSKAYCMYAINPTEVLELTEEQLHLCNDRDMPVSQGDIP